MPIITGIATAPGISALMTPARDTNADLRNAAGEQSQQAKLTDAADAPKVSGSRMTERPLLGTSSAPQTGTTPDPSRPIATDSRLKQFVKAVQALRLNHDTATALTPDRVAQLRAAAREVFKIEDVPRDVRPSETLSAALKSAETTAKAEAADRAARAEAEDRAAAREDARAERREVVAKQSEPKPLPKVDTSDATPARKAEATSAPATETAKPAVPGAQASEIPTPAPQVPAPEVAQARVPDVPEPAAVPARTTTKPDTAPPEAPAPTVADALAAPDARTPAAAETKPQAVPA